MRSGGRVRLSAGDEFTITTEDVPGDRHQAAASYAGLPGDVRPGNQILVDDGRVLLEVTEVRGASVRTIARTAVEVGAIVGAKALVAFTITGETARRLARYRSPIPLLAFTSEPATRSQLALTWGVETFIVPPARHTDHMVLQVENALLGIGRCAKATRSSSSQAARLAARVVRTRCGCTASVMRSLSRGLHLWFLDRG